MLAGRDCGREVRRKENLDDLDRKLIENSDLHVIVLFPEHIYLVASSFFSGMFADSIRTLGADRFRKQYRFKGPVSSYTISDAIEEEELRQFVEEADFAY